MKKLHFINVRGKVFPDTKTAGVKSKFSEKSSYQNSENVLDLVSLSL